MLTSDTKTRAQQRLELRVDQREWLAVPQSAQMPESAWQAAFEKRSPRSAAPVDAGSFVAGLRRRFGEDATVMLHQRQERFTGAVAAVQLIVAGSRDELLDELLRGSRTTVRPVFDRVFAAGLGVDGVRVRSYAGDPYDGDVPGVYLWLTAFESIPGEFVIVTALGSEPTALSALGPSLQQLIDGIAVEGAR